MRDYRVNAGLGDDLTVEEQIAGRENLFHAMASERHVGSDFRPDVVQEARIACWQALGKVPADVRNMPAWINTCVRRRVQNIVADEQPFFGQETVHAYIKDPLRHRDRESFDDPDNDPEFFIRATAPDVLDQVIQGYHEGVIVEALSRLPQRQREYVVLRFWGGWTNAEIAEVYAVVPKTLEKDWRLKIRPQLERDLAALVTA